ncbi:putative phage tail protein [Asaia bogorensis]|uniref:putative phage tail protein n=1 Tax=Asaia bogorensis TaxID=91915 RepID=UPI003018B15B
MSRTLDQIADEWRGALLPSGAAWPRDGESNLASLVRAIATMRVQLEADVEALQLEIRPGTSTLLLSDYRSLLGPDPCGRDAGNLTQSEWQQLLDLRWTQRGGGTIAWFENLGADSDTSIRITEIDPTICNLFVCGSAVCSTLIDQFTWIVTLERTGTGLECLIRRSAPADTTVVFSYQGQDAS